MVYFSIRITFLNATERLIDNDLRIPNKCINMCSLLIIPDLLTSFHDELLANGTRRDILYLMDPLILNVLH